MRFLIFLLLVSPLSFAELTSIPEAELAESVGQAFMEIDRSSHNNLQYTKVSLGLNVNTLLSADKLELGRYDRAGEAVGSSDIVIDNFALGHIDNNGNVVPFQIKDPFIELAYDDDKTLVGMRLGFGETFGKLSGDIRTLTGNINVDLYGQGSYLADQMDCGWNPICGAARLLVGGTWGNEEFAAKAKLVHGSGPNQGEVDPIRASHVGIENGQALSIPSGGGFTNFLLGIFTSGGCDLLSVQTCFPLTSYRTLDVGNTQTGNFATGMFLSFQSQDVTWFDSGQGTATTSGAFLNVPNGGIRTSFPEAIQGIPRIRTRYYE